ncbi:VOC family protein [Actinomadura macra]|uniref:VOC family protein n=1 Tax=Actinomadura macra TaxID=46164 RepID=UPI00083275AE|nr:VOC family protein [Actinomadura macra]
MRVKALAYLAVHARDLDAWEEFATAVLGLAPDRSGARLKLRLDERSYRLDIRAAGNDALAWIGWEVATPEDLAECRAALEEAGVAVERGTAAEIADREVIDLLRFVDPDGLQHELCLGASVAPAPVAFSRPGVGFVTGDLGLGHVALGVTDLTAAVDFFCGALGFHITDVMPGAFSFLRCNTRHHSAALMQWERPELHHILLQALDLEQVGRSLDEAAKRDLVTKTLGRHAIDDLVSFYVRTPSGWDMEIGFGGIRIDREWAMRRVGRPFSSWGHRPVAAG